MRILIIGGTGFIGSFVTQQLSELGHQVTVFHRGRKKTNLPDGVNSIIGNRRELSNYAGDFSHIAPEVVLDMILETEKRTQELVATVRGITNRIIAISSQDVYRAYGRVRGFDPGPSDPVPLTEESPLRETLRLYNTEEARRMYEKFDWFDKNSEKIEVERVIMGNPDLPGTILRLPAVYGPGDPMHRLFFDGLKRMDDNRPAILVQENVATWRWSRGYVENVASAITLAATDERASGRIYNVADLDALSQVGWLKELGKTIGWNGEILVLPKEQMPEHLKNPLASDQDWVVDTTRIRQELGYKEHIPRGDYLRQTVEWERANPPDEIEPSKFDYASEDEVLSRIR